MVVASICPLAAGRECLHQQQVVGMETTATPQTLEWVQEVCGVHPGIP